MKRYLLFGGDDYYARGGFHDFITSSDDLEELELLAVCLDNISWQHESGYGDYLTIKWYHIFDSKDKKIVSADGYAHGANKDKPDLIDCVKMTGNKNDKMAN